jgi:nucleotide-binding universal stress UspA family protein
MNVLVGVGGTDLSFAALDDAIVRATDAGDELTVAVYERESVAVDRDAIEQRVRERLDEAGVEATIRHVDGHVASQLVELADGAGFDRLVLAGGERSSLGKIRIGDLVEFVLLNSETTVTLVR